LLPMGRVKNTCLFFLPVTLFRMLFLMRNCDVCLWETVFWHPGEQSRKYSIRERNSFASCTVWISHLPTKKAFVEGIQNINIPSLKKLDRLLMVGNATIEEAVKIGIKREQCVFIPNGIDPKEFSEKHEREEISKILGTDINDKKIIFRLGDLFRTKERVGSLRT